MDTRMATAGLQPQVYVNVVGGVAEPTVTRGEVDVIHVDWDEFDDNVPSDDWLTETRADLERVADPEYRARLLADLDEAISRLPGICDACDRHYDRASRTDHCAEEGLCWKDCSDPVAHGAAVPA